MAITVPHLTDQYEELYDEIGLFVCAHPKELSVDHYRALFPWFGGCFGKRLWVEGHGGSLPLASRLLRHFPEARGMHVFRSECQRARDLLLEGEFSEIFVDAPLHVCEARYPKGLYGKALKGDIVDFTGFDSPYEPPDHPELQLDTTELSADLAADDVVRLLKTSLSSAACTVGN